jgi:hypothetical protein
MVRRSSSLTVFFCFLAIVSVFALAGCTGKPTFSTPYQVVLLDNGQAYFGKIENISHSYVLLTDVFYIQTQATPDGKVAGNVLVKRGQEWHSPDRMWVNVRHVIMIEPVAPESKVAQLIKEAKAGSGEPKK